jgi:hypothetical protein
MWENSVRFYSDFTWLVSDNIQSPACVCKTFMLPAERQTSTWDSKRLNHGPFQSWRPMLNIWQLLHNEKNSLSWMYCFFRKFTKSTACVCNNSNIDLGFFFSGKKTYFPNISEIIQYVLPPERRSSPWVNNLKTNYHSITVTNHSTSA